MDNRRLLLAAALSMAILLFWQWAFPPAEVERAPARPTPTAQEEFVTDAAGDSNERLASDADVPPAMEATEESGGDSTVETPVVAAAGEETVVLEDDRLLTARDVVTAISVPTLVDRLPREDVANVLERALEDGRQDTPFMDESFFEVVPLDSVVTHVPLATLWNWVLGAKIGRVYGLSTEDELFDSNEAHPDRAPASNDHSRSVTVVIDPDGTSPDGAEEPPLLGPMSSSKA